MFDTLRTAWRLAERVQEVERRMESLEDDWEDKLSRLKQLTGRLAKRDAREIERMAPKDDQEPAQDLPAGQGTTKEQLRAIARARGLGVPGRAVR